MYITLLKVKLRAIGSGLLNVQGSSKAKKRFTAGLLVFMLIYLAVFMLSSVGALLNLMLKAMPTTELHWFYFSFTGLAAFSSSVILGLFSIPYQVFGGNDNELLLSMPIPTRTILGVRITFPIALDFFFTLAVYTIAAVIYLLKFPLTAIGIIALVLSTLFVPMLAFAVSALIGWLIHALTVRVRNKNIISSILFLAFFFAYMYAVTKAQSAITALLANQEAVASKLGVIYPLLCMGRSISEGKLLDLLIWGLFAIIPFIVSLIVLDLSFVRILTTKVGHRRLRDQKLRSKGKSAFSALFAKEVKFILSCPAYFINCAVGILLLAIAVVLLAVNAELVRSIIPIIGPILPALICLFTCFFCSTSPITAPSISLEGKRMWIIRSLPIKANTVLSAKLCLHLVITAPVMLICTSVVCVICQLGAAESTVIILMPQLFNLCIAIFGLLMNLAFPKLDFISEAHAVKQGTSVLITLFGGMGVVGAFVALGALMFKLIDSIVYLFAVCAILAALAIALWAILRKRGEELFERI